MTVAGSLSAPLHTGAEKRYTSALAPSITRTASLQTYYTVRFLVDRDRVQDAYRAYAYFRWVDDRLDGDGLTRAERLAFVRRQAELVERCTRGDILAQLAPEEHMLAALVRHTPAPESSLRAYIDNMVAVMVFDAGRRGQLISETELQDYTHWLAVAVTEALHHFIGHRCPAPQDDTRYLAATGAHVVHMLRDALDDAGAGYVNIPREVLEAGGIAPTEVDSAAYRAWVIKRVQLARECFAAGRDYLARVQSTRCRLAGYAYIARFESILDAIERDEYVLQAAYPSTSLLHATADITRSALLNNHIGSRASLGARGRLSPSQG